MTQTFLSVGIDIGTTTTQVVISRLTMENKASASFVSDFKITTRDVLYRSRIHFTPLTGEEIDYPTLKKVIADEYRAGGYQPSDICTGAVIITGETARKENSGQVSECLSGLAGDFVVGTAGPDLEAILAGWGSGAGSQSKKVSGNVINFDIGGGTTNAAVFFNGEVKDAYALDIGGRLITFDEGGRIGYVSRRIKPLMQRMGLGISEGDCVTFPELKKLTLRLAEMFLELLSLKPLTADTQALFIGHPHRACETQVVSFSGGVAEYIYGHQIIDSFRELEFGDIGPLLGQCIRELMVDHQVNLVEPVEKIRATVIGAGNYSMNISGSTIAFSDGALPLKNIPVLKVFDDESFENIHRLSDEIAEKLNIYPDQTVAVAFRGSQSPRYDEIKKMAEQIVLSLGNNDRPIIVITQHDFAKALGQTISRALTREKPIICLDRIKIKGGDYIDIGCPISGVVPVVVKTLIFNT